MKKFLTTCLMALSALCVPLAASAEDIDLFMGNNTTTTDAPNVLIILDNTANWNTAFTNEMAALQSLFNGLPADKFRVGIMMFTETGGGNSGNDGAYVRASVRLLDTATKAKYAAMIAGFDQTDDKSNGGKAAKAMWEAYQYLKGLAPHAGNNKNKTDYTSNVAGTTADKAVWALTGNALGSKAGTTYTSPVSTTGCAKTYIIYISNGAAQDNTSDLTAATAALSAAGGSTTQISLNPSGSQDNVADEWARWMKQSSLGAAVYTVDINKVTTGQGPGWTALMKSMASESGGKYFDIASSGTQILDTLNNIFSEIQAVNSVFASVSLPISVNTQGTFLNQVFVGMFRPDNDSYPRWNGNLKQYKIGLSSGTLKLQDADSATAINSNTGFITECARSFWTPTTTDTEFSSAPKGDCLGSTTAITNSYRASNYPDGNVVEKGAHAYKLRSSSTRTAWTCGNSTCTSTVTFNTTNVTQTMLGASSSTLATSYVNWALGNDVLDENINGSTTDRRLSMHGDVVHSRPVAVNLGTDASPSVMVFYGGNDGWLRAINGNRTASIGTTTQVIAAGEEAWSFMPNEFISKIKRLYDNTPAITYPGSTISGASAKGYGMDGAITAYQGTVSGTSKVFVYATMRRGGKSIYAFDVTSASTTPKSPTYKWRVGCSANNDCAPSQLSGIGQTWSSVKTFKHANYSSGNTPLVIFGGGYDTCEDYDAGTSGGANHNCTSTSKGHYVYVLDGDTGAYVTSFDTGGMRGIIGDVLIATDSSGYATYGWVADLGGNVYRINFNGAAAAWTMTKIASLGCSGIETLVSGVYTAPCTAPRKFMFEPSVVANTDGSYTIYIGSGDREKPVSSYTSSKAVTNYFFSFTDKPTVVASTFPGNSDGCGANIICLSSLLGITGNNPPTDVALAAKKGWYINLDATEQVVTAPITIFGVVTFSTHQPATTSSGTCSANLGTTRVYNVNYKNAGSENGTSNLYQDVAGDGLPPSAVAGQVTLDTGQTVPFCIGCSPDSPLEAVQKSGGSASSRPKSRLYWYMQK